MNIKKGTVLEFKYPRDHSYKGIRVRALHDFTIGDVANFETIYIPEGLNKTGLFMGKQGLWATDYLVPLQLKKLKFKDILKRN